MSRTTAFIILTAMAAILGALFVLTDNEDAALVVVWIYGMIIFLDFMNS